MGSLSTLIKAAALTAILLPAYSTSVASAPQILAVASTTMDADLLCFDGLCSAELSSICLQEDRSAPYAMSEYYIHGDKQLVLTGHHADGSTEVLNHFPLTIVAARGYKAVRVSVPESLMQSADLVRISISVPENITVIPVAIAGDDKPQTKGDIEMAAGPWRMAATGIVDKNTRNKATAELVNHAINALPLRGRANPEIRDQARTYSLKRASSSNLSNEAIKRATRIVSRCHASTMFGLQNYRQCLGSWHDMLMDELNGEFWDATKTGS